MKKYPEVIAHFSEEGLKVISFTFEKHIFNVAEQSLIEQNKKQVIYKVLCSDGSEVELTLDLSTLKWSYF